MAKQTTTLMLLAVAAILLLSGCGAVPLFAAEQAADTEEEPLYIYTALSARLHEPYIELFKQQYPDIDFEIVNDSTVSITEQIISERDDPRVDVIWALGTTSLLRVGAEDMLEPYAPERLEEVNRRMRDINEPPLLVGTDVYMSAFCVNTELMQQLNLPIPTSWGELTNPIYRDHIIMPDPSFSGTGFIAVSAFVQLWGEREAFDYMERLHDNIKVYTTSGSQPCRLAGNGTIPIGISYGTAGSLQMQEGNPVIPVFPTEGSGWELQANALIRKKVTKEEAYTFLNWAISQEAMEAYAQNFPVTSIRTDVPLPPGYTNAPYEQLIADWSFLEITANQERVLDQWVELFGNKSEGRGAEIPSAFGG